MKRVSLLLYLGILLASLALGYLTWVREPKKQDGQVPVFPCSQGEILALAYEEEDQTVTFSKKKNAYSGESDWWVEMVRIPATEEAASTEEPPPVVEVFKASDRLQAGLDKFCPWTALRALGKLDEDKKAEFGLTESADLLTIEKATGPHTFRLGETTFGPKDRYVADSETGEAFLVKGQDLRDLGRPKSRFMERSLHAFGMKEVARVRVRSGEREKELVQQISEEGKEQGWADSRSPEETEVLYRNWMRRLSTLRPTEYAGMPAEGEDRGCVAPAGASQELNVTFFGHDEELGFLNLYKAEGTDGKGDPTYHACSEHSEIIVKVPKTQAEILLKDLEDVFSD
jgi:hypothetical protein